jgi:anhydro-N-acetylmuramic acid kinase
MIPKKEIIDYKEALIFAFMGVLKINNEINVLSSATGSSADHCSGVIA